MKIKIVSDLHLEFEDLDLKNDKNYDLLILAGDIFIAEDLYDHDETILSVEQKNLGKRQLAANRYRIFLKKVSLQFPHVIYIAGNHEFYHGKWLKSIQVLRDECSKYKNVYFLECDTVTIDNIVFIGATLWTDVNKGDPLTLHAVSSLMNDFRLIRNDDLGFTRLRPAHTVSRHRKTLDYFKIILDQNRDKKCVIISHHAPCSLSVHDIYKKDYIGNGCYYSDLSNFILDHPQIVLWTHGHMHNSSDYMIGDTRIVCNPRGYPGEHLTSFNPDFFIEV